MKARKFWMIIIPIALLVGLLFAGCTGSDGKNGKSAYDIAVDNGFTGTEEEWLALIYGGASAAPGQGSWFNEYCTSCHAIDGTMHQASYDQLYMPGIVEVSGLAYAFTGGSHVVSFEMTKFGNDFDCTEVESLGLYFTVYDGAEFTMAGGDRVSIAGTITWDADTNECTSTVTNDVGDLSTLDGVIVLYGRDETIRQIPGTRVRQARYPYADVLAIEGDAGVDYVSGANVAGCEKCHTVPYLKHGYILATPGGDFYTCKACHLDNGEGGHFMWQLLVDDPQLIITLEDEYGEDWEESGDSRLDKYAYRTSLMNDVHMSHAMEFPYPQSMSNCDTCHNGKLGDILVEANFTLEACKSCHPVLGDPQNIMDAPAIADVVPSSHATFIDPDTYEDASPGGCNLCHTDASGVGFAALHTGYNPLIYTDDLDGTQIADLITVSVDAADYDPDTDVLNIQFSAAGSANGGSLVATDIVPTVMVGLYGRDTKDYIIGPHARDVDGDRNLEFAVVGSPGGTDWNTTFPRATVDPSSVPGNWIVDVNLAPFAYLIEDGTVTKAEIAVMPDLDVALDAVSETFDLVANDFTDKPAEIVRVETGCNNCHDALNTTFHLSSGVPRGRGGSIEVCRLCHISLSGGSHLEMQSRSIDSYVHGIHSFQPFDFDEINFEDPVEVLHYEHHIGFIYPTLGFDCESCHNPGTFDVPDQEGSMPGLLSASYSNDTIERAIMDVPEYVTGPAGRACGACHRVPLINGDDAIGLTILNQHIENYGYLWENDSDDIILGYIIDVVFSTLIP